MLFALGITLLVGADSWFAGGDPPRTLTRADRTALQLARISGAVALVGFWLGLAEGGHENVPGTWWELLGFGLMTAGAALRYAAIRSLRQYFVTEVTPGPQHQFIQSGIYQYLRHPSEVGLLMALLGASLILRSWVLTLMTACISLPLAVARVRLEEAELRRAYPWA
jgi:protein-S-isoprenylcysteine O-methyltransferase